MRIKGGLFLVIAAAATTAAAMLALYAPAASAQDLESAVKAGDLARVKAIVEQNPRIVNLPNASGETILFAAIAYRQPAVIEYFISRGADVNVRTNSRMSPRRSL